MTRKQVNIVIKAICDRGIMFVEETPVIKDRITDRWMVSEITPYTIEQLVCNDIELEDED